MKLEISENLIKGNNTGKSEKPRGIWVENREKGRRRLFLEPVELYETIHGYRAHRVTLHIFSQSLWGFRLFNRGGWDLTGLLESSFRALQLGLWILEIDQEMAEIRTQTPDTPVYTRNWAFCPCMRKIVQISFIAAKSRKSKAIPRENEYQRRVDFQLSVVSVHEALFHCFELINGNKTST